MKNLAAAVLMISGLLPSQAFAEGDGGALRLLQEMNGAISYGVVTLTILVCSFVIGLLIINIRGKMNSKDKYLQ